jgi:ABC-type multidrug transport system fused ATPase/permease subunit
MSLINRVIPIDKVRSAFQILPRSTKKRLFVVSITQAALSILDLVALVLVASLGSLAVTGIQSARPSSSNNLVLDFFGLSGQGFQRQVAILGSLTAILLIVKTIASAYLNYRIFFFMSTVSAQISSSLLSRYVNKTFLDIKRRSSQETLQAFTSGVSSISNGIVGNFVSLVGDLFLLVIMLFGITSLDPKVGLFTLLFFGLIAILTYRYVSRASTNIAGTLLVENIASNNLVLSVTRIFREIGTRGLLGTYASRIKNSRFRIAKLEARQAFIPFITKYIMELTLIVGGLLLTAIQFATESAAEAISGIAVFILASSRISPAILRLQQSLLQVKAAVAGSLFTFEMLHELEGQSQVLELEGAFRVNHGDFKPVIIFENVNFRYPGSKDYIFKNFNTHIETGEIVSIIGPSGSGKTSFADLILGQLQPQSGIVSVSGLNPKDAQEAYPGAIAYVPQEIYLFEGSIKENLLLGFDEKSVKEKLIWEALRGAELDEWVKSQPSELDHLIKENGSNVSGGQRQRIGLARALLTKPNLLILDESTSSLDSVTEIEIAKTISKLKGTPTVISIAHRPAMIDISSRIIKIVKNKPRKVSKKNSVKNRE